MNEHAAHKRGMTGTQKTLVGCGITVLVLIVLVIAGGMALWGFGKGAAADMMYTSVVNLADMSQVPQDQRDGLLAEAASIRDGIKDGSVSTVEFGMAIQLIADSPVLGYIALAGAENKYLNPIGLDEQEKQDAVRTVARFMRGYAENTISDFDVIDAWYAITDTSGLSNPNTLSERQPRASIPDGELRDILDDLKQAADAANVPDEPYTPDAAEELRKAMSALIGP